MKFELDVELYDPKGDAYYSRLDYPQGHFLASIKYLPVTLDNKGHYILDIEINSQRESHTFSLLDHRSDLRTLYWGFQWIGTVICGSKTDMPCLRLNNLARHCFREWLSLSYTAVAPTIAIPSVAVTSTTNDMAYILAQASIFRFLPEISTKNSKAPNSGLKKSP